MMRIFLSLGVCLIALQTQAQTLNENFDNVFGLYTSGNWYTINKSNPSNTNIWYQDAGNFTAHSGAANSSITAGWYCTDTVGTGTASVWLFTPPLTLSNGDSISFYTISYNNAQYPDRLELRMNTTNTDTMVGPDENSTGNYGNLLLTINPMLDTSSYPMVWTKYTAVISGISPCNGRLAFRYYVPNTGGTGLNGSVVGIDDFMFKPAGLSVFENSLLQHINVYPNPTYGIVNIQSAGIITKAVLYDFTGRVIYTKQTNVNNLTIDCITYKKGVYMLSLETVTGTITKKITVE